MNQPDNWKMTPLDALICNNQLQILKTLVFFFPPARQRLMILLIKFMELRQCLTLPLATLSAFSPVGDRPEQGPEIFEHIFPYCDPQRQQTFKQMQNAFQMMRTVQQFSDSGMFDHLSEMMGGFGGMDAFAQMAGSGGMDTFAKMAGNTMNESGQTDRPHSSERPSSAEPAANDQLASILSSMMNPEQQAMFKEYEAMFDDL